MAREASNLQTRERQGAADVAQQIAQGEAASQSRELAKTQQLFQNAANEQQAAQARADQATAQKNQAIGGAISGGIGLLGSLVGGGQ